MQSERMKSYGTYAAVQDRSLLHLLLGTFAHLLCRGAPIEATLWLGDAEDLVALDSDQTFAPTQPII